MESKEFIVIYCVSLKAYVDIMCSARSLKKESGFPMQKVRE